VPSPPDSPESLLHRPLPYPTPLTAWEHSVLRAESEEDQAQADEDLLAGLDPHERVWSLGLASEVFLRAGALTTALVAAQKAALVAERCCVECKSWTMKLQADAHQALSFELLARARCRRVCPTQGRRWSP